MEDKDLDRLFREAFQDAEETPHSNNWSKIEAKLNAGTGTKPYFTIKKIGAIAACLTLICLAAVYYSTKTSNLNQSATMRNSKVDTYPQENSSTSLFELPVHEEDKTANVTSPIKTKDISTLDKSSFQNKTTTSTVIQKLHLDSLNEKPLMISNINLTTGNKEELLIIQVTEIDDIKPIIELEEMEETMLASTTSNGKENKTTITTVLNKLSENLNPNKEKTLQFIPDEEGSFSISIINSLAKNPNKKRK